MLATILNGIALQEALEKIKIYTRLMTAIIFSNWRNLTSAGEPFVTSRKAGSPSSREARAIPISRPIPPPLCGLPKSRRPLFSRPRKLTGFTIWIPSSIPGQKV